MSHIYHKCGAFYLVNPVFIRIMKLPKINLLEIYRQVLLEAVPSQPILDAIHNRNYVEINYIDEDSNAPGTRLIQPYAYGLSKANNPVLRAFQISGDSLRKRYWKTFRLDRIVSWKPRKQTFNVPPPMQGFNVPDYNQNGDDSMIVVYDQVRFDNIDTNDTLSQLRQQTQDIKTAPKIIGKNIQGPIPYASQQRKNNVFTSQPNSKRYAQYARNVQDAQNDTFNRFDDDIWAKAEAEKEQQNTQKMQSSVPSPKQSNQGPIDKDKVIDKQKEITGVTKK